MCNNCGCDSSSSQNRALSPDNDQVDLHDQLLAGNDRIAAKNEALFYHHEVLVINLMSSPGSGKTLLLEKTIDHFRDTVKIAVIEGDLETENDAQRIRRHGAQAEQISTGSACHLDASMVADVLPKFPLEQLDVLFIENVGNLICPACFDLGQQVNVVMLSVPEGDDKPEKYPVMFRAADLLIVNKLDYLDIPSGFSVDRAEASFRRTGNRSLVLSTSCVTDVGLSSWFSWIQNQLSLCKSPLDTSSDNSTREESHHADRN